MEEIKNKIADFRQKLDLLINKLKIAEKKEKLVELSALANSPGFWDDPINAQKVSKIISDYQNQISQIEDFQKSLISLEEMVNLPDGESLLGDLKIEIIRLEKIMDSLELNAYLSGKYDNCSAIMTIHSGQGGTEAMDWAQMLQRMYMRLAERRGWSLDVVDIIAGDEAGIKSVTMTINGPYVFGYLRGERGAHRLVRQSPFNADKLRQTSFCLVEVLPVIEDEAAAEIPESDIEWDFFHASSHGGQNVQKVSTAVRLKHKPSGIVVTSQSERYQERNREIALNLLRAKLWEIEQERLAKEKADIRGEYKIAGWGNQIRSYVLHPYKMVKDLRTDFESSNPTSVLDGELDGFLEAELKLLS